MTWFLSNTLKQVFIFRSTGLSRGYSVSVVYQFRFELALAPRIRTLQVFAKTSLLLFTGFPIGVSRFVKLRARDSHFLHKVP
ncbi:hypothetical protein HMPREF0044_0922 [Gleimia coleocanis DSM 15436]|uniref:Uncharacterized protein n=1 Tax=Gleimia coleocanis DSM 15436 TaxID=525245 RepID=C0W044_9ACTO|nr:hypothetical protein HMPREF0044_0922 [Gleimia coleocanis DSM 15436]